MSNQTKKPKEVQMQHITLEAHNTKDGVVLNISHLEARLNQLTDSRDKRGKIYPLGMILGCVANFSGEMQIGRVKGNGRFSLTRPN